MTDNDLDRFGNWLQPLIGGLSDAQRARLARNIGQYLRRSTAKRIAAQLNPDGTPYEPRKVQATGERAAQRRRAIRSTMFDKLRTNKFLHLRTNAQEIALGFLGRAARIATTHQEGLPDEVQPGGPRITYPARQLLGITEQQLLDIRDMTIDHLSAQR